MSAQFLFTSADWILPGLRSNSLNNLNYSNVKLGLAKAYNHNSSLTGNSRNLENRSYSIWCQILEYLTSEFARIIVMPQHYIYYDTKVLDDVPDDMEVDRIPNKQADAANVSDDGHDGHDSSMGDTSLDSIVSQTTAAEMPSNTVIPDFALIHLIYRWRNNSNLDKHWSNTKIRHVGIPLLLEVKRAPSRRKLENPNFKPVLQRILQARFDNVRQAAALFHMHRSQTSVILIACAGVWWSCRLAYRTDVDIEMAMQQGPNGNYLGPSKTQEEEDIEELEGNASGEDEDDDEGRDVTDDELDLIPRSTSESPEPDLHPDDLQPLIPDQELMFPIPEEWTRLMMLDTAASNQHLYLIHKRLSQVIHCTDGSIG